MGILKDVGSIQPVDAEPTSDPLFERRMGSCVGKKAISGAGRGAVCTSAEAMVDIDWKNRNER